MHETLAKIQLLTFNTKYNTGKRWGKLKNDINNITSPYPFILKDQISQISANIGKASL